MTQQNDLNGNTVIDVEREDHVAIISLMVKNVFSSASAEVDEPTLKLMANGIAFAIKRSFRGLNFDDLQTALQSGVCNVYGDVFKINVPTMCGWIEQYWNETATARIARRAAENKANNAKAIDQTSTITEEERRKTAKNITNSLYQSYLKGEERLLKLYDIAFEYLRAEGRLRCLPKDQWTQAMQTATAEVNANGGLSEKSVFRQAVMNTTRSQSIILKAKQIVVFKIFENQRVKA